MASGELVVASWPAGGWWLHHDSSGFDDSSTGSEWEDIGKRCDTPATAGLQLRAETCHGTRK